MKISRFLAIATAVISIVAVPSGPVAKRVQSISKAESKALHSRQEEAAEGADGIISLIFLVEDLIRNDHNAYVCVLLFIALAILANHCRA